MTDKNLTTASGSATGALGLDIGTSRIVLANGSGVGKTTSQLNAFLTVPFSKMTESILKQRKIAYLKNSSELFVYGNDSDSFAEVFNTTPRRPMHLGVLNSQEVMSQQIIKSIIQMVLPRSSKNELMCFSVPAASGHDVTDANLVYHEAVLKSHLESLGYQAKAVNEGLAVIFSELEDENFTGIGISCGGGMCNVCVAFLSVPVLAFSITKAGDYIDSSAAAAVGEAQTKVRIAKEETLNLSADPKNKVDGALHIYYEDVLQSLIGRLGEEFENSSNIPKLDRGLPIVLSGGTSKPKGFMQRFEKLLHDSDFPIPISDVRLASNPLAATAQGCYVAAMSEIG
jgi:actin-like ATPase involved in cell morphogenesis